MGGRGGKGKETGGGGKREQVPFEGRLLVFRRGNGVEETKGRLLLKKLDYLQVCRCWQGLLSWFGRVFFREHETC